MNINEFMNIHLLEISEIISELKVHFNSHDFLQKFAKRYEVEYIQMLQDQGKQGAFRTVHSLIAKFLSEHESDLRICKQGKVGSKNIFGEIDSIEQWVRITVIQDFACVKGVFRSILADSSCPTKIKEDILAELEKRTTGTVTVISPAEIAKVVQGFFIDCKIIPIEKDTDFESLTLPNNKTAFSILFWRGELGDRCHATRFLNQDQGVVSLMEPESGKVIQYSYAELFNKSSEGFDFVTISS